MSNTILLFFGFCHIVSEPHHWQPQLLAGKGIHRQHKLLEALSLSCCVFFLFCSSYCNLHSPIASLQQLFADRVFHHYCAYSVLHVLFFFPNESAINSELVNSYVYLRDMVLIKKVAGVIILPPKNCISLVMLCSLRASHILLSYQKLLQSPKIFDDTHRYLPQ